jgi:hypothetical protein
MRANLRETVPPMAAFGALFGVCYGGASWLATRHPSLPNWNLTIDAAVPFVPSMAVLYLTIIPVLMAAPLLFRTRREIAPLAATLSVETLIATAFFIAMPQTTAWTRPPVGGWAGVFFRTADALNLEANQFPSLHVAFACTAAYAYALRSGRFGRWLWRSWGVIVVASAWLIHEHPLVDLIGGAALAAVCVAIVYEGYDALWVELCCLSQAARFSLRHVRYVVIFAAIWGPSLRRWRERRVVRVAYCTAQWIDDLLDGDRRASREPLEIVEELLAAMAGRSFTNDPLSRLTGALFALLDAPAQKHFIELVREMRRDRERVRGGEVWPSERLDEHHRRTFHLSLDLLLIVTGCRARAADVPQLVDALAWCSTFRDLPDDLRRGLINIPEQVWNRGDDTFRAWAREQRDRAVINLRASSTSIRRLDDPGARRVLGIFQASIERFARKEIDGG